jgi:hypothetical protein
VVCSYARYQMNICSGLSVMAMKGTATEDFHTAVIWAYVLYSTKILAMKLHVFVDLLSYTISES